MDIKAKCIPKISNICRSSSTVCDCFHTNSDKIFTAFLIMLSLSVTILAYIFVFSHAIATDDIVPRCISDNELNTLIDLIENNISTEYLRNIRLANEKSHNVKLFEKYLETYSDNNYKADRSNSKAISYLKQINVDDESRTINRTITPIPEIIKSHGYPVEVHNVTSFDGYILTLFRIPYSANGKEFYLKRTPVLLMHGFLESSNGWVVQGPSHSLAYMLSDAGYDVWFGNARGTTESRKHIEYSPDGSDRNLFWLFSWHEIGKYDLPANIDYILDITEKEKLHYIGYSQGTTSFFVMMSERPKYHEKIISMNALAPVAFLANLKHPIHRALRTYYKPIKFISEFFKLYEVNVNNKLLSQLSESACRKAIGEPLSRICRGFLYMLSSNQINCSSIPLILEHTPAGASIRQLFHYIQLMKSEDFRQFDYEDEQINTNVYGSSVPPEYNLTTVSIPTFLYYSIGDLTAPEENVFRLKSKLPNVQGIYKVPNDEFTHVDFIYSAFVRKLLNNQILKVLNKIDKNDN